MTRGIRFKPDGVKWILEGKKTTTFRKNQQKGMFEIVQGSWFKPIHTGIMLRLNPIYLASSVNVVLNHYKTEGNFKSSNAFKEWLHINKLTLPDVGWLHRIEVQ